MCEMQPHISVDCARCGKRKHAFFDDPAGDLHSYLCQPRPWCERVIAIAHNARGFVAQFILNRAILLKWTPKLILNGLKVICMTIHHLTFLDSISFLPMALRKLPEAFGLSVTKSWYPHFFKTKANLNYVGPIPGIEQYGVTEMSESERKEFTSWYDTEKDKVFDYRHVLEKYCQDDVTVLRQACQIFLRDFMEIGNVDIFLQSCTIASACNKVLRKLFLKPETIGLIPAGGYSCNRNYSKKALMWILHMEQTEGCKILHARNGREFRLPEFPGFSVESYCAETKTVSEFFGCFFHGHKCQPFRDQNIGQRYIGRALRTHHVENRTDNPSRIHGQNNVGM